MPRDTHCKWDPEKWDAIFGKKKEVNNANDKLASAEEEARRPGTQRASSADELVQDVREHTPGIEAGTLKSKRKKMHAETG